MQRVRRQFLTTERNFLLQSKYLELSSSRWHCTVFLLFAVQLLCRVCHLCLLSISSLCYLCCALYALLSVCSVSSRVIPSDPLTPRRLISQRKPQPFIALLILIITRFSPLTFLHLYSAIIISLGSGISDGSLW